MIEWSKRTQIPSSKRFLDGSGQYSFLINKWIPMQPDKDELMPLFIDCHFRPEPFLLIVKYGDGAFKAAKRLGVVPEWHHLAEDSDTGRSA